MKNALMTDRILEKLDRSLPHVEQKAFASAGNGFAKTVLQVSYKGKKNKEMLYEAIRRKYNNKLTPVMNSWLCVESSSFSDTLIGIVSANREMVPYSEQMSGYKSISSNMYIDNEKEIWVLKETEGGKILVKTTAFDDADTLEELLESIASNYKDYQNKNYIPDCDYLGGDYVTFVNKKTAEMEHGYVVVSTVDESTGNNELIILPQNKEEYEVVNPMLVVNSFDINPNTDIMQSESMQAIAQGNKSITLEDILNYYRMVYSRNIEFFNKFAERLKDYYFA